MLPYINIRAFYPTTIVLVTDQPVLQPLFLSQRRRVPQLMSV